MNDHECGFASFSCMFTLFTFTRSNQSQKNHRKIHSITEMIKAHQVFLSLYGNTLVRERDCNLTQSHLSFQYEIERCSERLPISSICRNPFSPARNRSYAKESHGSDGRQSSSRDNDLVAPRVSL
jgi:hypothetical protein